MMVIMRVVTGVGLVMVLVTGVVLVTIFVTLCVGFFSVCVVLSKAFV